MKLWEALDKAIKELKSTVVGVDRKFIITIEDNPVIHILKTESRAYNASSIYIDVRDWEKIKNTIDGLLNKEI